MILFLLVPRERVIPIMCKMCLESNNNRYGGHPPPPYSPFIICREFSGFFSSFLRNPDRLYKVLSYSPSERCMGLFNNK